MQTDLILCLVLIVGWSRRTSAVDEKEGSLSSLFPHSDRAVGPGEELEKQEKIDKRPEEQAPSPCEEEAMPWPAGLFTSSPPLWLIFFLSTPMPRSAGPRGAAPFSNSA